MAKVLIQVAIIRNQAAITKNVTWVLVLVIFSDENVGAVYGACLQADRLHIRSKELLKVINMTILNESKPHCYFITMALLP